MTVNIYDDLNRLEATFRQTEQFATVEQAIQEVKNDEEALVLFKNFREVQLKLQEKQMQGEQVEEDELEHAQQTAQLAQMNEKIMKMLEAEMQLSGLLEEVNKVLMKPVQSMYESI
ncbi:YlbF family regulator [Sporosarcina sp. CAU 1771]